MTNFMKTLNDRISAAALILTDDSEGEALIPAAMVAAWTQVAYDERKLEGKALETMLKKRLTRAAKLGRVAKAVNYAATQGQEDKDFAEELAGDASKASDQATVEKVVEYAGKENEKRLVEAQRDGIIMAIAEGVMRQDAIIKRNRNDAASHAAGKGARKAARDKAAAMAAAAANLQG